MYYETHGEGEEHMCRTRRLLEAAEGDRLHAFYVVAVTAGLRPGEMLALRWSDVDVETGTLWVNRTLSEGEFATPKTPRSRRKIDLSNTAHSALRAHRKRQLEEKMKKAGLWRADELLASRRASQTRRPMRRTGIPAPCQMYPNTGGKMITTIAAHAA